MAQTDKKLPDKRTTEKALRDIGWSSKQAKRMVSIFWPSIVGVEQAALDEADEKLAGVIATLKKRE